MPLSPSADPTPSLEQIYRTHHGLVRWVLRARGVPEAALDDRVHDAFLAIFRRLPERDPSVPLRTWVAGVARNVGFSHRRSQARQRSRALRLVPPDDPPRPDELLERREAWRALSAFLDDLGPEQREVFVMVEVSGMRVSELAASMGMPANTLHSRLKVARTRFSQRFAVSSERRGELLQRAREQGRADSQQRRRTWAMIAASMEGLPPVPPAGAGATALAKATWLGGLGAPGLTVATIVAGVLTAGALVAARAPARSSTPAELSVVATAEVVEPAPAARPSVVPSPTPAEPPEPVPGHAASERIETRTTIESSTPRPRRPARFRGASPRDVADASPSADPDAELARAVAALARARDELDRGRAREALAALDELDTRFGMLERERRRLELDAACRLGDAAHARRAATALHGLGAAAEPEHPCRSPVD